MSRNRSKARECVFIFLAAAVGTFLARAWAVEARHIPSPSMRPGLQVGDTILVDKFTLRWRPVRRGEVVVCRPPVPVAGHGAALVKRVVGLPGERVAIRDRAVWIDGVRLPEPSRIPPIAYPPPDWAGLGMPGGRVPADMLFVLGDNRNDSTDSHVFGPVPIAHVIGRAVCRVWPLLRLGLVP